MQHLDEGMIHAWLDGELPLEERAAVEAHVAACDACKAAVAEARGFIAASSRILTALDSVPGGVVRAASAGAHTTRPPVRRRFVLSRAWMAAAAVLVLSTITVVAIRPGSEAAQLRVAAAARDERKQEVSAAPAEEMPQPAAPSVSNAPAPIEARKGAAITDASKPANHNERLKSLLEAPRKSADVRPTTGAAGAMAAAVQPARAPEAAAAVGGIAAQPATPLAPSALAKNAADSTAPRMLSRNTIDADGDTVVTTIYAVRGVSVSLIDHSRARDDAQRLQVRDAVSEMSAKSRAAAAAVTSLTWSDTTGHTRTLRGPLSLPDLQNLKRELFEATP